MALRAVPEHPKFATLKTLLRQPKGAVLGWLEIIWHFTGRFTPQGNIGKYTDASIEAWAEWDGEPGALVEAMVESGWLEPHPTHRLMAWRWGYFSGLTKRGRRNAAMKAAGGEVSRKMRTVILERDGRICLFCGTDSDLTIDHIYPIRLGGMTEFGNLQTLCRRCNSRKKDRVPQ